MAAKYLIFAMLLSALVIALISVEAFRHSLEWSMKFANSTTHFFVKYLENYFNILQKNDYIKEDLNLAWKAAADLFASFFAQTITMYFYILFILIIFSALIFLIKEIL